MWWGRVGLVIEFGVPGVSCPGVFGESGEQHDRGLVVGSPGGETPAVTQETGEDESRFREMTVGCGAG
jgi:hypothetical protein